MDESGLSLRVQALQQFARSRNRSEQSVRFFGWGQPVSDAKTCVAEQKLGQQHGVVDCQRRQHGQETHTDADSDGTTCSIKADTGEASSDADSSDSDTVNMHQVCAEVACEGKESGRLQSFYPPLQQWRACLATMRSRHSVRQSLSYYPMFVSSKWLEEQLTHNHGQEHQCRRWAYASAECDCGACSVAASPSPNSDNDGMRDAHAEVAHESSDSGRLQIFYPLPVWLCVRGHKRQEPEPQPLRTFYPPLQSAARVLLGSNSAGDGGHSWQSVGRTYCSTDSNSSAGMNRLSRKGLATASSRWTSGVSEVPAPTASCEQELRTAAVRSKAFTGMCNRCRQRGHRKRECPFSGRPKAVGMSRVGASMSSGSTFAGLTDVSSHKHRPTIMSVTDMSSKPHKQPGQQRGMAIQHEQQCDDNSQHEQQCNEAGQHEQQCNYNSQHKERVGFCGGGRLVSDVSCAELRGLGGDGASRQCAGKCLRGYKVQPGTLGLQTKPSLNGEIVVSVNPGGQGEQLGVQPGWELCAVDGLPFDEGLLLERIAGSCAYFIVFSVTNMEPQQHDQQHWQGQLNVEHRESDVTSSTKVGQEVSELRQLHTSYAHIVQSMVPCVRGRKQQEPELQQPQELEEQLAHRAGHTQQQGDWPTPPLQHQQPERPQSGGSGEGAAEKFRAEDETNEQGTRTSTSISFNGPPNKQKIKAKSGLENYFEALWTQFWLALWTQFWLGHMVSALQLGRGSL
jgi:hypothetical protein